MSPRVLDGPHFITTSPSITTCHHCRRPILAATVAGIDIHVDTTPVTPPGELAALLAGQRTYDLAGERLIRRDRHRIASTRQLPVMPAHHCRPIDPAHVDHSHLEAAVDLVRTLLGAEPATTGGPDDPAPF